MVVVDGGDVALIAHVVVVEKQPLVGPNEHLQGWTMTVATAVAIVAVGEGGGWWKRWCAAMFGNGWLSNIPIIINHYLNY